MSNLTWEWDKDEQAWATFRASLSVGFMNYDNSCFYDAMLMAMILNPAILKAFLYDNIHKTNSYERSFRNKLACSNDRQVPHKYIRKLHRALRHDVNSLFTKGSRTCSRRFQNLLKSCFRTEVPGGGRYESYSQMDSSLFFYEHIVAAFPHLVTYQQSRKKVIGTDWILGEWTPVAASIYHTITTQAHTTTTVINSQKDFFAIQAQAGQRIPINFPKRSLSPESTDFYLQSIIMFSGDPSDPHTRGHYIALIRDTSNQVWEYDDTNAPRIEHVHASDMTAVYTNRLNNDGPAKTYHSRSGLWFSPQLVLYLKFKVSGPPRPPRPAARPVRPARPDRTVRPVGTSGAPRKSRASRAPRASRASRTQRRRVRQKRTQNSWRYVPDHIIINLLPHKTEEFQRYLKLLIMMRRTLPAALRELNTYHRKIGHWAWYAFPTQRSGQLDTYKTSVSHRNAHLLFQDAPLIWKQVIERAGELVECYRSSRVVIPSTDYGRIAHFIKFWENINHPTWFDGVLSNLTEVRAKQSPAQERLLQRDFPNR